MFSRDLAVIARKQLVTLLHDCGKPADSEVNVQDRAGDDGNRSDAVSFMPCTWYLDKITKSKHLLKG